jgi:hypothetical protein
VQYEPGVDNSQEIDSWSRYPSYHWIGEQETDFIHDHLVLLLKRIIFLL